jgi:hypothetical protein
MVQNVAPGRALDGSRGRTRTGSLGVRLNVSRASPSASTESWTSPQRVGCSSSRVCPQPPPALCESVATSPSAGLSRFSSASALCRADLVDLEPDDITVNGARVPDSAPAPERLARSPATPRSVGSHGRSAG